YERATGSRRRRVCAAPSKRLDNFHGAPAGASQSASGSSSEGWSLSVGSGTADSSSSSLRSSWRGSISCSVMKVVLPDNSELELPEGSTGLDAARAIGPKLAEEAVLVRSNGRVQDLRLPLADGQEVQILTTTDKED